MSIAAWLIAAIIGVRPTAAQHGVTCGITYGRDGNMIDLGRCPRRLPPRLVFGQEMDITPCTQRTCRETMWGRVNTKPPERWPPPESLGRALGSASQETHSSNRSLHPRHGNTLQNLRRGAGHVKVRVALHERDRVFERCRLQERVAGNACLARG